MAPHESTLWTDPPLHVRPASGMQLVGAQAPALHPNWQSCSLSPGTAGISGQPPID
jgi:hypothetical protein